MKTEATTGRGVPELWQTIQAFRAHSEGSRVRRLKARNEFRLRDLLTHRYLEFVEKTLLTPGEFDALIDRIAAREVDPYSAAEDILTRSLRPTMKVWLDHLGIAVQDVEQTLTFFRDVLGLHVDAPEEVASQRVRAHFLHLGPSSLELLEATAPDSPIAKFVEKRGPGHAPRRPARGRHRCGARVSRRPRHPPDRRVAAARRRGRAASRSFIRRPRTACWWS